MPAPTWKLKAIAQQPPTPCPLPEASFRSPLAQPLPKAWRRSCPHVRQSCLSYLRTQGFSCCIPVSRGSPMQAGVRLLPGAGVQQGGSPTPALGRAGGWETGASPSSTPAPREAQCHSHSIVPCWRSLVGAVDDGDGTWDMGCAIDNPSTGQSCCAPESDS